MKHESTYRVPYADTDQMGVVYYANYLEYFERSRTEMLRSVGFAYRKMEELGFFLPVAEAHCNYLASAKYDDLLTFRSWVAQMRGVRLVINTEVWRDDTRLAAGGVTLACVNSDHKIIRLPQFFIEKCQVFLETAETEGK